MKKQIKHNQVIGQKIEELIAREIPNATLPYFGRGPFDIETPTDIIEVKSCQVKTKGLKKKTFQYLQTGRFILLQESHKNLKAEGENKGKQPKYSFVLYVGEEVLEIIDKCFLTWAEVDLSLKLYRSWKRKDGTKAISIPHTAIFPIKIKGKEPDCVLVPL